jgi:hypothetical protein
VISVIFFCNIAWLWIAADSIRHRSPEIFANRLLDYMRAQAGWDIRVSPKLIDTYNLAPRLTCSGAESTSSGRSAVVFLANEADWYRWIANRPGFAEQTISSYEVNYDYYPTWWGHEFGHRIVILRQERAQRMGVQFKDFMRCAVRPP